MRVPLVLLLAAGTLSAAPVPKELRKADDKAAFVGLWRPADKSGAWFHFRADGTLQTWHPPGKGSLMDWTWGDVDSKATPKRVTLTRVSDKQVYRCAFEFSGDTLKFLFLNERQEAPAALDRPTGDFRTLTRDTTTK